MRTLASRTYFIPLSCILFGFLVACATAPEGKAPHYRLKLAQEADLRIGDQPESRRKADEVIELDGKQPARVEAPGYMTTLLLPPPGREGTEVTLKLKPQENWDQGQITNRANVILGEAMSKINRAQRLLARQQPQEALRVIEELKASYPQLNYLKFLQASAWMVMGEREQAKMALKEALKDFPSDEAGLELLKSLEGGTP